jgi:hypothetical protein
MATATLGAMVTRSWDSAFRTAQRDVGGLEFLHRCLARRLVPAIGPAATLPSAAGLSLVASAASVKTKICRESQSVPNPESWPDGWGVALMSKQVLYRWAIYLIRGRGMLLGSVHAPDQKSAIAAAIEKFGITTPQAQLLAQRIGSVHRRSQRKVAIDIA